MAGDPDPEVASDGMEITAGELEKVVLEGDHVNKNWVGKDAGLIAKQIGISGHGHDLRLLMCEVEEDHPFVQHEMLMPVIPLFRVRDAEGNLQMPRPLPAPEPAKKGTSAGETRRQAS